MGQVLILRLYKQLNTSEVVDRYFQNLFLLIFLQSLNVLNIVACLWKSRQTYSL